MKIKPPQGPWTAAQANTDSSGRNTLRSLSKKTPLKTANVLFRQGSESPCVQKGQRSGRSRPAIEKDKFSRVSKPRLSPEPAPSQARPRVEATHVTSPLSGRELCMSAEKPPSGCFPPSSFMSSRLFPPCFHYSSLRLLYIYSLSLPHSLPTPAKLVRKRTASLWPVLIHFPISQ